MIFGEMAVRRRDVACILREHGCSEVRLDLGGFVCNIPRERNSKSFWVTKDYSYVGLISHIEEGMAHRFIGSLFESMTLCSQREDYLYVMLAMNLLIPQCSAESNVLMSSQSLRFALILVRCSFNDLALAMRLERQQ